MVNGAFFTAQIHHHADFLLRNGFLLRLRFHMKYPQHGIGGKGQEPYHRPHNHRNAGNNAAAEFCHLHGLLHGDPFGHQLAEYQSPETNIIINPSHQILGKIIRRKGASQESGQCNAHLYGGQEGGRFLHQLQKLSRFFIPFLLLPAQLRCVQGNHRNLRRRKKGVQ